MKPTIGRIVLYNHPSGRTYPALVTQCTVEGVSSEERALTGLTIFTSQGQEFLWAEQDELFADGKPVAKDGTWCWPPRV